MSVLDQIDRVKADTRIGDNRTMSKVQRQDVDAPRAVAGFCYAPCFESQRRTRVTFEMSRTGA